MIKKLIFFLSVCFLFASCATVKVRGYQLEKSALPEKVRIVQISDFHSNTFGKNEEKLLSKVRAARPDLIFLTGDIFDYYVNVKKDKNLQNCRDLLSGLNKIAPFFYVSGNHEFYFHHNGEWSYLIEEYGGKILHNETVLVQINQGIVEVTGIGDPFEEMTYEERINSKDNKELYLIRLRNISKEAADIKKRAAEKEGLLFSVLLAHRPEYISEYLKYDYDLILSGHAHGGQWRFPPFNNGLYAPGQGLFPKYAGGLYKFKDSESIFIVSRGLSYQSTKIPRLFNPPELVVIDW